MHQVAVGVTQYLHLDVAGAAHQLFQIDAVVPERRKRLAPRHFDMAGQLGCGLHYAHASAASAPARLEHERVAHFRCLPRRGFNVRCK